MSLHMLYLAVISHVLDLGTVLIYQKANVSKLKYCEYCSRKYIFVRMFHLLPNIIKCICNRNISVMIGKV